MEPADADAYFGRVLRETAKGTRLTRAQALKTYFLFLESRHKVEIHNLTGRVLECPIDELNRPRGGAEAKLRILPTDAEHWLRRDGYSPRQFWSRTTDTSSLETQGSGHAARLRQTLGFPLRNRQLG